MPSRLPRPRCALPGALNYFACPRRPLHPHELTCDKEDDCEHGETRPTAVRTTGPLPEPASRGPTGAGLHRPEILCDPALLTPSQEMPSFERCTRASHPDPQALRGDRLSIPAESPSGCHDRLPCGTYLQPLIPSQSNL